MAFSVNGDKGSRLAVAVFLAAALLTPAHAYRLLSLDLNGNHSLFVLSPAAHDQHESGHRQADLGFNRGLFSALQVNSRTEKETSESEEKASGSEAGGSNAEEPKEKEGSAEAGEEAEEEGGGGTSAAEPQEGSKAEKKTDAEFKATSVKEAPSVKEEEKAVSEHAPPTTEKESAAAAESAALSKTPSAAEGEAAGAAPHAAPVHGMEPSAKEHAAQPHHEPAAGKHLHGPAKESHAGAPHEEAAKTSKVFAAEKPEHRELAAGVTLTEAKVPSPDKLVVQLNFRPSMVIGRADADKVERHVITEKAGSAWYEVLGEKALTILKLMPMEGEKLLHTAKVTEQPTQKSFSTAD